MAVSSASANADVAVRRFSGALPSLAALENAVLRLARALRKTQRRCNALSKIFIPSYQGTVSHLIDTREGRERESLVILQMICNRSAQMAR